MDVKPGYKLTEVGVIPEDWKIEPLMSVTPPNVKNGIVDGPFGSNLKTIHYRNSGIPIITSGYVTDGKFHAEKYLYVDQAKFNAEKRSAVKPGDIVMAKIGERCGASAILPTTHEVGILSGNALKITVDSQRHFPFFIWQVLWKLYSSVDIDKIKTVGAQPAISMANLKKHKIPLPPTKAEQEAIAEALSDADALIESLDQIIAKKRQIKQGAMQELLTGKKRLPGFCGDWDVKCLGEILTICHGKSQREVEAADGLYPILATGGEIGRANRPLYDKPSVLIGRKGTIDRPQYMDTPFWTVDTLFFSLVHEPNYAKFIFYRFCLIDWKQHNEASGVPSLNARTIEKIEIACPEPDEQTAIAAILSDLDAEIAALEDKLAKARRLKQGMMQELLTGRIRLI